LLVAIFFAEIGVKPAQMTKLAVAIFLDQLREIFDHSAGMVSVVIG